MTPTVVATLVILAAAPPTPSTSPTPTPSPAAAAKPAPAPTTAPTTSAPASAMPSGAATPEAADAAGIERNLTACLARTAVGTGERLGCYGTAASLMDRRLSQVFTKLMGVAEKSGKKPLLKDAQEKWLLFREAEEKLAAAFDDSTLEGTRVRYELLKERAEALERRLQTAGRP